jgi:predicted SnoaL-like aldol condensation-catalyzing enzyme
MKAYLLFGINFKQHIPSVAHGSQALGDSIAKVVNDNPSAWKPKRVVGDGDLVVVHGHRRFSPDDRGVAVVNILRIVDGKIVEQWTVGRPVPETPANENTMF